MSRVVKGTVFVSILFLLLIDSIPVLTGYTDNLKIINAYSIGDKVAFVVLNTTSNKLYALTYNGHSFEVEPLNFTTSYLVRHWNGKYWLLQKGRRGTVSLYTYQDGVLKLIRTFNGGSLCTDNDLEIKWNGREYLLTFIEAGPHNDPNTGECTFKFKDYILKDENLVPLNVTGREVWIPALNAWLIGESLVDENGKVLGEYNFSKTGIYSVGLAVDDGKTFLVVSSDGGWVRVFTIRNSSLVLIYNRRLEKRELGEGPYPPKVWIGKPMLLGRDSHNDLRFIVWLFNGTDFIKIHAFEDYAMLYPLTTSNRSYILSRIPINMGTYILLNLFELRGFSLVQVSSLKVRNNYLRVINMKESKGFSAPKVEPGSMLVASGENSVFLFNSSHIFDLTSRDSIELPNALKNHGYRVALCCGGWIVFDENKIYFFKNDKFSDITPEMISVLSERPKSNNSLIMDILGSLVAVVIVVFLLVFLRKSK
ncbi:putative membrane protein [Thermococcus sp. 2319x1]|uniref:hypothetical protein n=1 Tax=Thermococcus sp. 2319x1 TaxID=1674923 RepID=UPI00073ABAEB|nr:hypothetical protein [Thermococcus sp. 2319x1]ALV63628.1 putative membrane protein [Thermococcus sp. 2319x1]